MTAPVARGWCPMRQWCGHQTHHVLQDDPCWVRTGRTSDAYLRRGRVSRHLDLRWEEGAREQCGRGTMDSVRSRKKTLQDPLHRAAPGTHLATR